MGVDKKMKTLEINSQPFELNSDMEKGFLRGSAWENLYCPYKFSVPKLNNLTEFEQALYVLQVYTFVSIELALYISTHSSCKDAVETLNRINLEKDKVRTFVEQKFGGLSAQSPMFSGYFDLKEVWCNNRVGV